MSEKQRDMYRVFAYVFISIGVVFLLLDLLEEIFAVGLIKGNPFPAVLLVMGVGFALLWTVRKKDEAE